MQTGETLEHIIWFLDGTYMTITGTISDVVRSVEARPEGKRARKTQTRLVSEKDERGLSEALGVGIAEHPDIEDRKPACYKLNPTQADLDCAYTRLLPIESVDRARRSAAAKREPRPELGVPQWETVASSRR